MSPILPATKLHHRLTLLRNGADENFQIRRKSRRQLWQLLAETYLWWRDASQEPEFLNEEFRKAGIKHNKLAGNTINFRPVISLVWDMKHMTASESSSMSYWAKSLQALHKRFSENPEEFSFQPVGKLVALYEAAGGITEIGKSVGEDEELVKPSNDEEEGATRSSDVSHYAVDEPTAKALAENARQIFSADKNGVGTIKADIPLYEDNDRYSIILAQVKPDGRTIVHGSTNDPTIIETVLRRVGVMEARAVDPALLALGDAIRVQMFPFVARPADKRRSKWFLERFADKTDFYTTDLSSLRKDGKKRKLKSSRRVHVVQNGKRIIVSGGMLRSSPVVVHDLKVPIFEVGEDVFLRTVVRPYIEELFDNKAAHLFDVEAIPRQEGSDQKSVIKVFLQNRISGRPKILHFYPVDRTNIAHQIPIPTPSAFVPLWKVSVSQQWMQKLKLGWARPWFEGLGRSNYIGRAENERLKITLRKDRIVIGYANDEMPFSFDNDAEVFGKLPTTEFFSKDLAPYFYNVSDLQPLSTIDLAGNKHGIRMTFESLSGFCEIIIPSINAIDKPVRNDALFMIDGAA